jgi:polyhydroxyalkanoate synthase
MAAIAWPSAPIYADRRRSRRLRWTCGRRGGTSGNAPLNGQPQRGALEEQANKDKRFNTPQWRDNPLFDMIRQSYLLIADRMLGSVDAIEGVDDKQREKLRFAARAFVDAMSPSNFALTNPMCWRRRSRLAARTCSRGSSICCGISARGSLPIPPATPSRLDATSR